MSVLIAGVTGQEGALLARQLIYAGVSVVGMTRDPASADRRRLVTLGIDEHVCEAYVVMVRNLIASALALLLLIG